MKLGSNNISSMRLGSSVVSSVYLGETKVWPEAPTFDGLTFTCLEAPVLITYSPSTVSTAQYSTDGTTWNSFDGESVMLQEGDSLYVKGDISGNLGTSNYAHFSTSGSGKLTLSGNINSLINSTDWLSITSLPYNYIFYSLFYQCANIQTANGLMMPAIILTERCYGTMFRECSALQSAPALPATVLNNACYYGMFYGCSSLTSAPELPATTIDVACYNSMFNSCSSLTSAPELPATSLTTSCYENMFSGCTSLTTAPDLPSTTLAAYCYQDMFSACSSLTTAPDLPATTLAQGCYNSMFNGCSSLTTAPELPATTLAPSCYSSMFRNCSLINYVKHNITSWNIIYTSSWLDGVADYGMVECPSTSTIPPRSVSGIPTDWIKINDTDNQYLKSYTTQFDDTELTLSRTFPIASSSDWTVVSDSDWLTVSQQSGPSGLTVMTYTASSWASARRGHLTFTNDEGLTFSLEIHQTHSH